MSAIIDKKRKKKKRGVMAVGSPKVAVAVFIVKGKKLLIGKRQACVAHSYFSIPSGHLEFGYVSPSIIERSFDV